MKKISLLSLVVLLSTGMILLHSCQGAKNSTASKMLKFGLEKGKAYDYETIMNMDQEVMGQKMTMDFSTYYSMNVADEQQGERTIATTIDRFKMNTSVAGFNIDIDTDKPVSTKSDDEIGKAMASVNSIFNAIKGQKFSMKVNAEGQVLEVTGLQEMAKRMTDSLDMDPAEKAKAMEQFSKSMGDDQVKYSLERFWFIFPNKEVKVGDSWKKNSNVPMGPMPGKYNSTYTVKDIEGDMVTLEESSTIDGRTNEGGKELKMEGTVKGTMTIDSRSGLVVNGDQDIKMIASGAGLKFNVNAKSKIKGTPR
jgi:hypothetical protein